MFYIVHISDISGEFGKKIMDDSEFHSLVEELKNNAIEIKFNNKIYNIKDKGEIKIYEVKDGIGSTKEGLEGYFKMESSALGWELALYYNCTNITEKLFSYNSNLNKLITPIEQPKQAKKIRKKTSNLNAFRWEGTKEQKIKLFEDLKENNFIHVQSKWKDFDRIFSGISLGKIELKDRIRWIDPIPRLKDKDNFSTLCELILLLQKHDMISKEGFDSSNRAPIRSELRKMICGCFCYRDGSEMDSNIVTRGAQKIKGKSKSEKALAKVVSSL